MAEKKLGLIREGKIPTDSRVPLTPEQCVELMEEHPGTRVIVQPSSHRCYSDQEYRDLGIEMREDLGDCEILLGVKEVPMDQLIPGKTYLFFSHTIKKQAYNQKLLQTLLKKNIHLVDWECLKDERGLRVIAFGHWAGIVGAYNALYTWGLRSKKYTLPRAKDCHDYQEIKAILKKTQFPPVKIVVSGDGRVAFGAVELLHHAGVRRLSSKEFLEVEPDEAVFTQLTCSELYTRISDGAFDLQEFFREPQLYRSAFDPYTKAADLFINAIYWDPMAPAYFSAGDIANPDFRIRAIADITCDIAPASSIPSTLKASTIADPLFGYDRFSGAETTPFHKNALTMMTIDNLPSELPRDSSQAFGEQFLNHVIDELLLPESRMIEQASICREGQLGSHFHYLSDYAAGK